MAAADTHSYRSLTASVDAQYTSLRIPAYTEAHSGTSITYFPAVAMKGFQPVAEG